MTPTEAPAVCALGRPLGECHLRSAGCTSLYDVLISLYPPPEVLAELRSRPGIDADIAQWLHRLEGIGGSRYEHNRRTASSHRRS